MDVKYVILFLFLLISCQPQPSKLGNGELASGNSNSGNSNIPASDMKWNFLNSLTTSITINASNLNNAYITGSQIENYLSQLTSNQLISESFCLVSKFSISGIEHQYRARVVPISYYDFTAKRTVRIFRADFQDVTNALSFCGSNLLLQSPNSSGVYQVETAPPISNIKQEPSALCSTCTSVLTASTVRLFRLEMGSLKQIPTNIINFNLGLRIDPNNNSSTNTGSCSSLNCAASGYDCCLDNQCVNDGGTRPSATTQYSSELLIAEQEKLQNPLAYLNYPHLYYICGSSVPGSTTGSTGGGGYDAAFEAVKKDYFCMKSVKTAATSTPFHQDLLNTSLFSTIPSTVCHSTPSDNMYYQNVAMRLYQTCGCNRTTLIDMITYCPAYEYQANNETNPTVISCYTPPPTTGTGAITPSSVPINSRTAPHRYFNSTGVESASPSGTQEGDEFSYLDSTGLFPVQTDFSMNAILGQMTVALDKALPAKSVSVNLDQIYYLASYTGYYTPCPTCSKDMWLSTLSAFPSTRYGVGLQSVGHTTERNSLSTNTSGGNYEDTIFGRACWLPPTMIPFSHSLNTNIVDQRKNRLRAQAALFANGYQRDWFGFNKGALIGSFDGVTWFAIGKGRIIKATSTKLYLAINAPFADLASPTIHTVNIQPYDGTSTAADVDYDPQYTLSHSYQNEAGSCQANHLCSTDTDCVTRLGWEYMCADVGEVTTNWPQFNPDSTEKSSSVTTTIDQILAQKRFPSSSTKRCVYRGAGAPCLTSLTSVTDLNKKKTLTCAPNFYCAGINTASFNSKIARYAGLLEDIPASSNHFYGKDANVLGRPLHYIPGANGVALGASATTIRQNIQTYENSASSFAGLCLPGKLLPEPGNEVAASNPFTQHQSADPSRRTDFISQISSCNSTLFTSYRHSSCPVIDAATGNYEMFATASILSGYAARARNQNACGLETLLNNTALSTNATTMSSKSPFISIEAKPLNQQVVVTPTLARDACLRRAGQVCHTDLDCSPNKFHAEQVDLYNPNYFGNAAEKKYHQEYLVCGQTDPKPLPSQTTAFRDYDMSKNRCCRPVGLDLTTYTADIPTSATGTTYDIESVGLKMSVAPGMAPSDPLRYSRLATVENLGTSADRPVLSAFQGRTAGVLNPNSYSGKNVMTPYQWKTLGEANSESCCGGGWIRKFSDGGNDWTRRDRIFLDVNNFKCINARSPLLIRPELWAGEYNSAGDVQTLVNQDIGDYCKDNNGSNGMCAQYTITDSTSLTSFPELDLFDPTVTLNTVKPDYPGYKDYYFNPRSGDSHADIFVTNFNDTTTVGARKNITIKIPSFISRQAMTTAITKIKMITEQGSTIPVAAASYCTNVPAVDAAVTGPTSDGSGACTTGNGTCCYSYNSTTRILKVVKAAGAHSFGTSKVGITFDYVPVGWNGGATLSNKRFKPGNNLYYLTRLGKLELSGIPQITYDALQCSDNVDYLVPGILKPNFKKYTDTTAANSFSDPANSFSITSGATAPRYTSHHNLDNEPVFSANDFKCCTPLGKTNTDKTKCCSGYGVAAGASGFKCALPAGTNLMVYFNRFVSNEGRNPDEPGGPLLDADFNQQTGEPLVTTTVIQKIQSLGAVGGSNYCASGKVRQGGAFGAFGLQPSGQSTNQSQRIYNIVDSSSDYEAFSNAGGTVTRGYSAFMNGFRWNHHLYCDD